MRLLLMLLTLIASDAIGVGSVKVDSAVRPLDVQRRLWRSRRVPAAPPTGPTASVQVHLESGVANGVLVVRSVDECAEVLYKLLTNSLAFSIEQNTKQGCTLLKEKISQSPFRAVSNYEKMANSFWNFYLLSESKN